MVSAREQYERYRMIRDCVNYQKCKKLPLQDVRHRVAERMSFVSSLCHLSEEEIYFAINYCEEQFPALV